QAVVRPVPVALADLPVHARRAAPLARADRVRGVVRGGRRVGPLRRVPVPPSQEALRPHRRAARGTPLAPRACRASGVDDRLLQGGREARLLVQLEEAAPAGLAELLAQGGVVEEAFEMV